MYNKQKKSVLIPLALLTLVGTLALGLAQLAHATNENSYKIGHWFGYNDYNCINTEGCDIVNSAPPTSFPCKVGYVADTADGKTINGLTVTNSTACSDGYVNGWKDWCKTDVNQCTDLVQSGNFPDIHRVLKSDYG